LRHSVHVCYWQYIESSSDAQRLDAFDSWSVRKILWIPYTVYVTDAIIRQTTPAVVQSSILFKRDGSASLGMWHMLTFSRIIIGLLRSRSDWPVIGGRLSDAHITPGWGGSTLLYSQLTLGSTPPGEKPVTKHFGDASLTRQHSIKRHGSWGARSCCGQHMYRCWSPCFHLFQW